MLKADMKFRLEELESDIEDLTIGAKIYIEETNEPFKELYSTATDEQRAHIKVIAGCIEGIHTRLHRFENGRDIDFKKLWW